MTASSVPSLMPYGFYAREPVAECPRTQVVDIADDRGRGTRLRNLIAGRGARHRPTQFSGRDSIESLLRCFCGCLPRVVPNCLAELRRRCCRKCRRWGGIANDEAVAQDQPSNQVPNAEINPDSMGWDLYFLTNQPSDTVRYLGSARREVDGRSHHVQHRCVGQGHAEDTELPPSRQRIRTVLLMESPSTPQMRTETSGKTYCPQLCDQRCSEGSL